MTEVPSLKIGPMPDQNEVIFEGDEIIPAEDDGFDDGIFEEQAEVTTSNMQAHLESMGFDAAIVRRTILDFGAICEDDMLTLVDSLQALHEHGHGMGQAQQEILMDKPDETEKQLQNADTMTHTVAQEIPASSSQLLPSLNVEHCLLSMGFPQELIEEAMKRFGDSEPGEILDGMFALELQQNIGGSALSGELAIGSVFGQCRQGFIGEESTYPQTEVINNNREENDLDIPSSSSRPLKRSKNIEFCESMGFPRELIEAAISCFGDAEPVKLVDHMLALEHVESKDQLHLLGIC